MRIHVAIRHSPKAADCRAPPGRCDVIWVCAIFSKSTEITTGESPIIQSENIRADIGTNHSP
eukprot:457071-Pyramimonas_sp.AAC.1